MLSCPNDHKCLVLFGMKQPRERIQLNQCVYADESIQLLVLFVFFFNLILSQIVLFNSICRGFFSFLHFY